jgi:hypothetical protein
VACSSISRSMSARTNLQSSQAKNWWVRRCGAKSCRRDPACCCFKIRYGQLASNSAYRDWQTFFASTRLKVSERSRAPSGRSKPALPLQISDLHDLLRRYDLRHYGCIGLDGFVAAMKRTGLPLGAARLRALFSDLDVRAANLVRMVTLPSCRRL